MNFTTRFHVQREEGGVVLFMMIFDSVFLCGTLSAGQRLEPELVQRVCGAYAVVLLMKMRKTMKTMTMSHLCSCRTHSPQVPSYVFEVSFEILEENWGKNGVYPWFVCYRKLTEKCV